MATIQELQYFIRENINEVYPEPEAGAIAQLVLEHVLQKTRVQLSMQRDDQVTQAQEEEIKQAVVRLQKQEPVQYVLGVANFYGLELQVDERVLIPRPETEELVDRVIKQHKGKNSLHILDICTGSGCIPLALAANLEAEKVMGLEVSAGALEVAKANASKLNLPVEWLQHDVFEPLKSIAPESLDIVTSNPPYVREDEKQHMRENVLQYEPHLALFVPNADPLKYYKRIAAVGLELLKKGGKLYFEINEQYGAQVAKLLLELAYSKAEVVQDLFGKDRMVEATK
ncbi:peptide chain release factor N(5)-glutamine methyltransferase [Pontibacter locisalis]|uniref:Release factor glutamine methyltransferase n=1 Tax=Pontibacter locisalis TaxID=1719035 RepID=A0ABW5IPF8_9BACT